MSDECLDLLTKVCPYVVLYIIRDVGKMEKGETRSFIVDDPLAIKSIPEELTEYEDITVSVDEREEGWEIVVTRE